MTTRGVYWSIKGLPFLQNANNLNFKLLFQVVYMTHNAIILPLYKKNFGLRVILNVA